MSMATETRRRAGRVFVWIAAAAGTVHAAFSAYWALGGTWLLRTVGQWAVDLMRDEPLLGGLGLALVTLLKLLGAYVPVAVEYGRIGARRFWRAVSWIGAVGLSLYGGANTIVGALVLAGWVEPGSAPDREALIGHTFLWDPLFLVWGAALVVALALTRRETSRRGVDRSL